MSYKLNKFYKALSKNRSRRELCKHANNFTKDDLNNYYPLMNNQQILLGTNDFRDLYVTQFLKTRVDEGLSTITENITVLGNTKKALEFINKHFTACKYFSSGVSRVVIQLVGSIVEVEMNSTTLDFRLHGTFEDNNKNKSLILSEFEVSGVYVDWVYDSNMSRVTIPVDSRLAPIDEMYPFLGDETLDEYYNRFLNSSSNILILLGKPGNGKTSFIRGYLCSTDSSAMLTYDEAILSKDSLYSEFIESNSSVLVLEDADMFLSARSSGNNMMHKFLNVGDGLATVKGKKMIFSTNLPSVKDIDAALLRPGRCFDVLNFDSLNKEQADKLAKKIGINFDSSKSNDFTIAEIYSGVRTNSGGSKSKFGFI